MSCSLAEVSPQEETDRTGLLFKAALSGAGRWGGVWIIWSYLGFTRRPKANQEFPS